MAKLSSLMSDSKKVNGGVWVDYTDGVRLLIARKPNDNYDAAMVKALQPYRGAIRAGTFTDAMDQKVSLEVISKTVLIGWNNIEDEESNPIEYSPEKALELLTDPDIRRFVLITCMDRDRYRKTE